MPTPETSHMAANKRAEEIMRAHAELLCLDMSDEGKETEVWHLLYTLAVYCENKGIDFNSLVGQVNREIDLNNARHNWLGTDWNR